MKISVIVPIYKVENEIERCLLSVLKQRHSDIELILVNDCTPDNSFIIAQAVICNNPSHVDVKIIEHERNQGLSGARNSGMTISTGDYIFFLDSDDNLTTPDSLATLHDWASRKDKPDLVIGNYQYIVDGKIDSKPELLEQDYNSNSELFIAFAMKGIYWSAWARLVKRSFIEQNNFSFKKGLYSEDILWTFQLFRKAKRVYITPEVVYDYFNRPGSIMFNLKRKHVDDLGIILMEIYKSYKDHPNYFPKQTVIIIERYRRMMLQYLFLLDEEDHEYRREKIHFLQHIHVPLKDSGSRYFRQNILLRLPVSYVVNYLGLKWKNKRRKH